MEKKVNALTVKVVDEAIQIHQHECGSEPQVIEITPDQVVQLIEWLRECRDKLQKPNV